MQPWREWMRTWIRQRRTIVVVLTVALAFFTVRHQLTSLAGVVGTDAHDAHVLGTGLVRVIVATRRSTRGDSDVIMATALALPRDSWLVLHAPRVVVSYPDVDEGFTLLSPDTVLVAHRLDGSVVAASLLDLRGDRVVPGAGLTARLRRGITNLVETGTWRGVRADHYTFAEPMPSLAAVRAGGSWDVGLANGHRMRIDADTGQVTEGGDTVRWRPREFGAVPDWLPWLADTLRATPAVGVGGVAWMEGAWMRTRDSARRVMDAVGSVETMREPETAGAPDGMPEALDVAPGSAQSGEGRWQALGGDGDVFVRNVVGRAATFHRAWVHPDPERGDVRAYVVAWRPGEVELHVVPGSIEPVGPTGETGSGAIPFDENTAPRVVAAFNGGFQALHGEYGLVGEGQVLLPPKPYAATVARAEDGATVFGTWPAAGGETSTGLIDLRQNMTALVEDGRFDPWHRGDWGPVTDDPDDARTERSALCAMRDGHVAFVWGKALAPRSLARAMLRAHCTWGMHLDMNGTNTGFDTVRIDPVTDSPVLGRGAPGVGDGAREGLSADGRWRWRARRLATEMQHRAGRWLERQPRDFFYLALRPSVGDVALARDESGMPAASISSMHPSERSGTIDVSRLDPARLVVDDVAPELRFTASSAVPLQLVERSNGVAAWSLTPAETSVPRAVACIDGDGFAVVAWAPDGRVLAEPEALARAIGCVGPHARLADLVVSRADVAVSARGGLALRAHARPAVRMLPPVPIVPPAQWRAVLGQRVRYFPVSGNNCTVQVRMPGHAPFLVRSPGVAERYCARIPGSLDAPPVRSRTGAP